MPTISSFLDLTIADLAILSGVLSGSVVCAVTARERLFCFCREDAPALAAERAINRLQRGGLLAVAPEGSISATPKSADILGKGFGYMVRLLDGGAGLINEAIHFKLYFHEGDRL